LPQKLDDWRALPTAAISDALDRLGLATQCLGLRPLAPTFRLVGRAFTVLYRPVGVAKGNVGDYIDEVAADQVCVLDNSGRLDATVWGDILTGLAHRKNIAGTVIHGVCRDSALSLSLNYPVYSRGVYMRTGKDRVQADGIDVPISLGEVRVEAGDLLIGDADGVVVVPQSQEQAVLDLALSIESTENQIRQAVESGTTLTEARKAFGYHALQRKQN
jgi:4-hydroxy-4-methyl-2-oxoglutarate aldolase